MQTHAFTASAMKLNFYGHTMIGIISLEGAKVYPVKCDESDALEYARTCPLSSGLSLCLPAHMSLSSTFPVTLRAEASFSLCELSCEK